MPKVEEMKLIDPDGKESIIKYFVNTKEENLESLRKHPLIIATSYYGATGEGNTLWAAAGRFKDEEEMKQWLTDRYNIDPYYLVDFNFYINKLPPKEETACRMLVSQHMMEIWGKILDGEMESGYLRFFAVDHMNFS